MFLHCSCIDLKKTDNPTESVAGLPKATTTRINRINAWKKNIRILSLPFRANYDSTVREAYRVQFGERDSLFRKDFKPGDTYLIGLLPDTTNFYGFVFHTVIAVSNPGLITFDKSGNKLDLHMLTKDNCLIMAGDILYCQEYTTIYKDLSLEYHYQSKVVTEFIESHLDTICEQQIQRGRLTKKGKVKLESVEEMDCSDR